MADDVYKVGRTQQDYGPQLKRFGAYPGDSELVYVRKCTRELVPAESAIIRTFRARFGSHARGNEYFVGDERLMINIINKFLEERDNSPMNTEGCILSSCKFRFRTRKPVTPEEFVQIRENLGGDVRKPNCVEDGVAWPGDGTNCMGCDCGGGDRQIRYRRNEFWTKSGATLADVMKLIECLRSFENYVTHTYGFHFVASKPVITRKEEWLKTTRLPLDEFLFQNKFEGRMPLAVFENKYKEFLKTSGIKQGWGVPTDTAVNWGYTLEKTENGDELVFPK